MNDSGFVLDDRLQDFGHLLTDWPLSRVLLASDANYPWLILIPRLPGLRELHDLPLPRLQELTAEIHRASLALCRAFDPDKVNIAALGNQVPQLHIHVIARYEDDKAWPHPVWGRVPAKPYAPELLSARVDLLRRELDNP
jgi:diadenosine tetraphosphate (Ap4A) HIT family hydrolase